MIYQEVTLPNAFNMKMTADNNKLNLKIMYMNTYGQTKLTLQKQLQIEDIVKKFRCDIIHMQESNLDDQSFDSCSFIKNNYNLLKNNSLSGYGTATLIHKDFNVVNECYDVNGRIILFVFGSWYRFHISCCSRKLLWRDIAQLISELG